ncbi:hypothetical protein BH09BAC5_BH09BAC5_11290 [soil metagenome]
MSSFRVVFLFFKCFISYYTGKKNKYAIAFESLLNTKSYRMSAKMEKDILLPFRYFKKSISLIFNAKEEVVIYSGNSKSCIYGHAENSNLLVEYIEENANEKVGMFIDIDKLGVKGFYLARIEALIGTLFLFPVVLIAYCFTSRKANWSMMVLELNETIRLSQILKKNKIDFVYDFNSFEKSANFNSLVLSRIGIKVGTIVSASTLTLFYKKLISYCLYCASPYQIDELKSGTEINLENYFVEKVFLWPYIGTFGKKLELNTAETVNNCGRLGFISRGLWRRRERNDIDTGESHYRAEDELMEEIRKYILSAKNNNAELVIYTHPCEKETDEIYRRGVAFYEKYFHPIKVIFPPKENKSNEVFSMSEVAISVLSNTNFERLFCGFKTVFAPFYIDGFPVKNSSIANICAANKKDLFPLLDKIFEMNTEEYFVDLKLSNYRYQTIQYGEFTNEIFNPEKIKTESVNPVYIDEA